MTSVLDSSVGSLVDVRRGYEASPIHPDLPNGHVRLAARVVAMHVAEQWPTGVYCHSDRTPFPCRLQRWGSDVLLRAGWGAREVAALAEEARGDDQGGASVGDRA